MNFFPAPEITANYVQTGFAKTSAPVWKILLLGVFGGMAIALAAAAGSTAGHDITNVGVARTVMGFIFPFGLGIVVVAGAELFTGACLILISVLDGKVTIAAMLRNWFLVYTSNFIGSLLVASGGAFFGQLNYSANGLAAYTIKVAAAKCAIPFRNGIVLGIFCNVLVCLGVFMAFSAKDTPGRIMGAFLPVALFVICGFEHSVANMYYIPAGLFAMQIPAYAAKAAEMGVNTAALTWGNFLFGNLVPVTIGNIIGGTSLAAMFWVCHLRKPPQR